MATIIMAGLFMVVIAAVIAGVVTYSHAYACGQADALRNRWWSQLVYKPDGSSVTVDLDRPTTMPSVAYPARPER